MIAAGGVWAPGVSVADLLPPAVKNNLPPSVLQQLAQIKSMDELNAKIAALQSAIDTLNGKIATSTKSRAQMKTAIDKMISTKAEMQTLLKEMKTLNAAIPGAFETAKTNYLAELDGMSNKIESVFQSTLNKGYQSIYLTAAVSSALAILLLLFYRRKKPVLDSNI